ncbi:FecCD family ABC transporter permease [Microvirga pudoricolor]|uniref:FecCD family ABC transporter permease n=1 Tax=Microvirga pudoricolor TaxID=2778729 RepID=UPI0019518BA7|nr:iron ABC transporter permease [Microvirga pudoricolor]MBM6596247.1 iron ABC transporter permease [Microvirga pudoricolor]
MKAASPAHAGLQGLRTRPLDQRVPIVLGGLALLLVAVSLVSLGLGAVGIPVGRVIDALASAFPGAPAAPPGDALVVLQVRLPRLLLGLLVGAGLAVSGTLMQGLFRNPLADPAIVGVSTGAALAAAVVIVMGPRWFGAVPFLALPVGAFCGCLIATLFLYLIATRDGRTSIATMLLGGVAFGALAWAFMGFLSYLSNDQQLRDLNFWSMGSLSGSTWAKTAAVAPFILPAMALMPFLARGLNALSLGEAEAFHLGLPVQRVKAAAILLVAVMVGASVAAAGIIGFVGIIVPHTLRVLTGADHRLLLPASALLGGALLVGADSFARTVVAPAEMPIGILTAIIGAPFFLWLLLGRQRGIGA